ncbi:hypothetical protein V8C40DRAFT_260465 [Trichoderma camerunense]
MAHKFLFLAPVPLTCFGVPAYPTRRPPSVQWQFFTASSFLLVFRVDYTLFYYLFLLWRCCLFSHELKLGSLAGSQQAASLSTQFTQFITVKKQKLWTVEQTVSDEPVRPEG